jgi:hypothetical protein
VELFFRSELGRQDKGGLAACAGAGVGPAPPVMKEVLENAEYKGNGSPPFNRRPAGTRCSSLSFIRFLQGHCKVTAAGGFKGCSTKLSLGDHFQFRHMNAHILLKYIPDVVRYYNYLGLLKPKESIYFFEERHYGRTEIPRVPNSSPSAKNQALGEANLPRVLHSGKKCTWEERLSRSACIARISLSKRELQISKLRRALRQRATRKITTKRRSTTTDTNKEYETREHQRPTTRPTMPKACKQITDRRTTIYNGRRTRM